MSRFKLIALVASITLAFGVALASEALAGEKFKIRGVYYTVKWEQIDVGDQEGHIVAVSEGKGIMTNKEGKPFGDGFLERSASLLDMNTKTGVGSMHGYCCMTDRDGDKIFSLYEGELQGGKFWKVEFTVKKGTGKFEGIKGKGTFSAYPIAPMQTYSDMEWEVELPR